jgi:hypothetical protein
MSDPRSCPICHHAGMVRSEGRLDQSGDTFLPTILSSCGVCGYTKFDPAVGVRWKSEPVVAAPPPGVQRKAA